MGGRGTRLSHPLFVACQRVPRNERGAPSGGKGNWLHHKYCGLFSHVRVGGTPCTHRQATYPARGFLTVGSAVAPLPPLPLVLQLWQAVVAAAAALAFFMLQPGCSNNAQANEACIRQLHLANWHAPTDSSCPRPPFSYLCNDFPTLCGYLQH